MKKVLAMLAVLALVFCLGATANAALAADAPEEAVATDTAVTPSAAVEAVDAPLTEDAGQGSDVTQAINNVVSAAIKFVIAGVVLVLTKYVIPFAKATVAPFIRDTIIPWFEEHRLRSLVDSLVHGAEQLANSGQIPKEEKKQYVVEALKALGVDVTPEVDAVIEGAVLDLDKTLKELLQAVLDEIKGGGNGVTAPPEGQVTSEVPDAGEA